MVAIPSGGRSERALSVQLQPHGGLSIRALARIRYQLLGGLLVAALLPALVRNGFHLPIGPSSLLNTLIGTAIAMIVGAYFVRRMIGYPGVHASAFVLPAFGASYGAMVLAFFFLRVDYSRFQFLTSFTLAVLWFTAVLMIERRYKRPRFAVLPFGRGLESFREANAETVVIQDPRRLPSGTSGVVADLRADLSPEWEHFLAFCALSGVPVYHSKQVAESLTGRVEIEHLSENSLGSLLPSSIYIRFKRMVDIIGVVVAIPALLPIACLTALLIKLDDGGPVFFVQSRVGYRGETFNMLKFRSMRAGPSSGKHFTEANDTRITRIGRFIRRYRVDEIPQVLNILRGEMSWIGPRPESVPLSTHYEAELPFYIYRHIVRPGISGWAQVQQGNVGGVDQVRWKLHYDFYYIKHFSPWLDLLIAARTLRTVLTGFGAR